MERFFATFEGELGEWCDTCGEDKMELFDYIEAFDNWRRRHSTLGQNHSSRARTTGADESRSMGNLSAFGLETSSSPKVASGSRANRGAVFYTPLPATESARR